MIKATHNEDVSNIKTVVKGWKPVQEFEVKFDRLSGLSNIVYKVSTTNKDAQPSSLIYRKFGDNEEMVDRDQEDYIFKELSLKEIGPTCYGGDNDYRVEEYFESRPLNTAEVRYTHIQRKIAKNMAAIHKVTIENLDPRPAMERILDNGNMLTLFEEKASQDIFTLTEQNQLSELITLSSEEETDFLRKILPKTPESVVFSHNDLHSQNILLLNKVESLIFIDYEYAGFNYRGYDIANLFNESTISYENPEYPYYYIKEKDFPSEKELKDFVKYYLIFLKIDNGNLDYDKLIQDDKYCNEVIKANHDVKEFDAEIEKLCAEVEICQILSHYYWCIWSVIMSKNPEIDLDYIKYAYDRFQIYKKLKQKYMETKMKDFDSSSDEKEDDQDDSDN